MALKRKFKKINKGLFITYIILAIGYLLSIIFLTSSLLNLNGIETFIRITVVIVMFIFWLFYTLYGFIWLFEKKKLKLIIISIIVLILIPVNIIGSIYINKTYNIINSINKDSATYTSNLVILNNTTFTNDVSVNVGLITNENDMSGNVLAKEIIVKQKLNNVTVKYYDDYQALIEKLYDNEIQGAFLPNNYVNLFVEDERYANIASETKVLYKTSRTVAKNNGNASNKKLTEPFTVLLLGVDSTLDGLTANQSFNGDAIMMITFNPNTLTATFLSIPRDTYVPITCLNNREAKINKSAYSGASCMIDTITKLTSIDIDYYFKMNFTGLVDLVNALGGIDVDVPYKFCEQNSKREFGENTIYVNAGRQHLNGEEALALARNRKAHPEYCTEEWNQGYRNDFQRGLNQQIVVQGILSKLKNTKNIDDFYKILSVISNNMDTNMSTDTILSFYDVGKNIVLNYLSNNEDMLKIQKLYLQTSTLMILGSSTEQYQKTSLKAIVEAMKYNLEIETPNLNKSFSFDTNKPYEESLIGKGLFDGVTRKTVPSLVGKQKADAVTWATSNNITASYIDITASDDLYDDTLANGTIVSQSVVATTLLESITSITFYVIKK